VTGADAESQDRQAAPGYFSDVMAEAHAVPPMA
jgi:hypothetical protein